jgi:multidrug transporter EmrE-like cation transporter
VSKDAYAESEMSPFWKSTALVLLLSCIGVAADTLLKLASTAPRPFLNLWFLLGLISTGAFAVVWVLLMQTMKLATAGVIYAVVSSLLLVCVGIFMFDEKLSGSESTGVVMAIVAVVLLARLTA